LREKRLEKITARNLVQIFAVLILAGGWESRRSLELTGRGVVSESGWRRRLNTAERDIGDTGGEKIG